MQAILSLAYNHGLETIQDRVAHFDITIRGDVPPIVVPVLMLLQAVEIVKWLRGWSGIEITQALMRCLRYP
jgi:hypothetical protein